MTIVTKYWKKFPIRIREKDLYVCLTDMAQADGKKYSYCIEYLLNDSYLKDLSISTGVSMDTLFQVIDTGLDWAQGTWGHFKMAIRLAQWCGNGFDVEIASWIKELSTTNSVSIPSTKSKLTNMISFFNFLGDNVVQRYVAPVSDNSIRFLNLIVDKDLAVKFLKRNHPNNRQISETIVALYSQILRSGQWVPSDPIKFDKNMTLIDGQHRLTAIARTNVQTELQVLYNYPTESIKTFDRGKKRTFVDISQIDGRGWITSSVYSIYTHCKYNPPYNGKTKSMSDIDRMAILEEIKDGLNFLHQYRRLLTEKNINDGAGLLAICLKALYSDVQDTNNNLTNLFTKFEQRKNVLNDFILGIVGMNPSNPSQKDLFKTERVDYVATTDVKDIWKDSMRVESKNLKTYQWTKNQTLLYCYVQKALKIFITQKRVNCVNFVKRERESLQDYFPSTLLDKGFK
jgi:hypothetical protein